MTRLVTKYFHINKFERNCFRFCSEFEWHRHRKCIRPYWWWWLCLHWPLRQLHKLGHNHYRQISEKLFATTTAQVLIVKVSRLLYLFAFFSVRFELRSPLRQSKLFEVSSNWREAISCVCIWCDLSKRVIYAFVFVRHKWSHPLDHLKQSHSHATQFNLSPVNRPRWRWRRSEMKSERDWIILSLSFVTSFLADDRFCIRLPQNLLIKIHNIIGSNI